MILRRRRATLTIIVIGYEMARELPRTVRSLCRPYQQGVDDLNYEIVVVDHGSPTPLNLSVVESIGDNVRCVRYTSAVPSPAPGINRALAETRSEYVGIVLDGARMVTPGVLALARQAFALGDDALVAVLGWHLGPGFQNESVLEGYGPDAEDALLDGIEWPADGYRLFEIASLAKSNRDGIFGRMFEAPFVLGRRSHFERIGAYDERFVTRGGGLVNPEFFGRAVAQSQLVVLLGEGSFHQVHGGATTNAEDLQQQLKVFYREYRRIFGKRYEPPQIDPSYFGRLPLAARRFIDAPVVPSG